MKTNMIPMIVKGSI